MAEQTQQISTDPMADFLATTSLDALDEPSETQPPVSSPAAPPPETAKPAAAEETKELDPKAELLQALGLDEGDGETPSKDDAEGATPPEVDLKSLAGLMGFDEDQIRMGENGLEVQRKIDGETAWVSPTEMRKGYQLQSHTTRQTEQFLKEKQEWEQAVAQHNAAANEQAQLVTRLLNQEETELREAFNKVPWDQVREDSDAEYAAKMVEFQQKQQQINGRRQELYQGLQREHAETVQRQQAAAVEFSKDQASLLADRLGWKTQEDRAQGAQALQSYLLEKSDLGLTPQEVAGMYDHRVLALAHKAQRYDELMDKVTKIKSRKAKPQSKTVPSGAAGTEGRGSSRRTALDSAKSRLAETGSVEDAASVFSQLGV